MYPTLNGGPDILSRDRIAVDGLYYKFFPKKRGDIIIFVSVEREHVKDVEYIFTTNKNMISQLKEVIRTVPKVKEVTSNNSQIHIKIDVTQKEKAGVVLEKIVKLLLPGFSKNTINQFNNGILTAVGTSFPPLRIWSFP